ncbi:hypothetical protein NEOLEDRAFT_1126174 [Neolentinus lepideus HHB14362 ss-1]|uniref:DUF7918 domain-containing protein n=1 Tax=Neolentinus lepideus HHB14362 ss-1 TaxID=1314782 RepID=A0A165W2R0_9AGAM|nr:hypothetical protein NEOLEDRAFT_1126174 [Neolentinus lepideus HHB14362 ss-1]
MPQCNDFSAWITVDGVTLEQYSEQRSSGGRTVTCWIASEVGKAFHVHWEQAVSYLGGRTGGYLNVDGFECGGVALDPARGKIKVSMTGHRTSESTEKPLIFSSLDLTDDDHYLENSPGVQNLGQIKLEIWRIECTKVIRSWRGSISEGIPKERKIHERTKKAGSHSVKLGDDAPSIRAAGIVAKKLEAAPVATFVFRYNSIDVLRANGIAPQAAATARQVSAKDVDVKPKRKRTRAAIDDGEMEFVGSPPSQISRSSGTKTKKVKREPLTDEKVSTSREVIDLT